MNNFLIKGRKINYIFNNMSNNKLSILEAPKLIQMAREHAILGYYQESLAKYQSAMGLIKQRVNEIKDEFLREKWKITELNVKAEINQTIQIFELCKNLKNENFDYDKKQYEDSAINRSNQNTFVVPFDSGERKPNQKKMPNVNHFGGKKPFSQIKENQDPFEDFNKQEINSIGKDLNQIEMNLGLNNFNNNNNRAKNNNRYNIQDKETILNINKNINTNKNNISSSILNSFCKDLPSANENYFNFNKNDNNIFDRETHDIINNTENVVVYKKPIKNAEVDKKDPSVWDPPMENKS
jgi:hypothetical protein